MIALQEHDHANRALELVASMTSPDLTDHLQPRRETPKHEHTAVSTWLMLLAIVGAVVWLLAGIHETTVRACPTMDSACQINQESPE